MYENYIDFSIGMRVNFGNFKSFDVVKIESEVLCCGSSASSLTPIRFADLPCLCVILQGLSISYAASDKGGLKLYIPPYVCSVCPISVILKGTQNFEGTSSETFEDSCLPNA
jgi:hypothetical protein